MEGKKSLILTFDDIDVMVLNLDIIASGQTTATAIKAAYEPMNLFSNMFEAELLVFVNKILIIAGFDIETAHYSFKRDRIVNELEQLQAVQTKIETYLSLKGTFDDDTIIRLCAEALELGSEETERIIQAVTAEESSRLVQTA